MTLSWPELVTSAAAVSTDVLVKGADQDWVRPAGGLDWSCRATLDHLALGVLGYAGLLIARPVDRYITLFGSLDPQAPIPACLEGIRIAATLLASTVRDAAPETRAWHPWGHSDGPGFAAMGVTELLMHTHDIAATLGVAWTPPDELCAPVVERIFPDAPTGHAPAQTLLWCTGRTALPGLPRRRQWQWDGRVR
ncbi:maleylpyruvate isomerase N-terminal domain-containing protein [Goodfellowiella coeruleoviolacea]|uniref:Mycothiol maleylpyruvate isomerase N-terminal domain-containing protein n=1 Tax=Goodfellowiella coeruleoviolacea TaxID=334858 RepID=A0AAE3KL92_9PSEU|nr:maleylpyruvate isomerase N-terminal domain-containing protein [Goodfellowiella coeruleoviolacea]MCP2166283.1 Mycothiol maleylpyruvate isomerase N-terminal domain-containing protein [Goodfellowiella coeruleoviolacea]